MFVLRSALQATLCKSQQILSSVSLNIVPNSLQCLNSRLPILTRLHPYGTGYDPYSEYPTPSPFKPKQPNHFGYKKKFYDGGPLPRPAGKYEDIPVKMPQYDAQKANKWTEKRALFGQNDYIDILGDGTLHPYDLHEAPTWLRGFKGSELHRLIYRLKAQYDRLKDLRPERFHQMMKQTRFLFKRYNRRKRKYLRWGRSFRHARIDKIKDL